MCGCCLMQSFSLGLQQPFITLALGTSFAGPAVVTNCSAVLQNCLNDQMKLFHWWPKPEFVPPWGGRACVLTPSTACHCLCQQPALWAAAGVQKAKEKCLRFALVLSHSKWLEPVQVHGKLQAVSAEQPVQLTLTETWIVSVLNYFNPISHLCWRV